ncbi:porin [Vibrio aestuarianus]|uniref:Outer membrane protein U n=1 Tax=Vibrio aestuarianus TaxID=28171 RepID=A0A0A1E7D2_9VIBR|nr:porin [Vibrio aestuarianus]AIY26285.1 outer membrane protein U [Vibrio aestuarianus subsp. francensis]MDE1212117.1 porin [Vibrio aestuarianus]MDE1217722.1 porin [Vibrio aestuarianus]MDE1226255.1 porin [Vibrio aestuarianus]MDE1257460.1 porin [Vibrio aestuarianus]
MNKTLIALAVSAAAVATGVNAEGVNQSSDRAGSTVYSSQGNTLEIGGRAEARLSVKDGKAEDASRVRLNFLGKVAINDSLYGVGFYEGEFTTAENGKDTDTGDSKLTNRYGYAGIGGNFGEVTYGKNDGALGVITDFTDIMSYHGNTAADKIAVADRSDNMLSYKGQFADFGLKASYRFADRKEQKVGDTVVSYDDNGADGYSISGIYAFGDTGFKLGAGYADQAEQNEYMVAASLAISDAYIAAIYTDGEKAETNGDYTGYEVAFGYDLGSSAITATYNNAEINDETSANNFAIDYTYYFKPNFRTYISYNFNMIDEGDKIGAVTNTPGTATKADAEDELALGLRYDF